MRIDGCAPRSRLCTWNVKEGRWRTLSLSLRLVTWPLVGVCLTFSMAVGKERSMVPLPPPPPNRPHPGYRDSTITHASECKLPEAVNHFEKIPDSPRAPSLRVCLRYPFPLLSLSSSSSFTPFFAFFYVLIESCPRSIVLSRPRLAFVGLRKVTECSLRKGSPAPIDGRGMCSGP